MLDPEYKSFEIKSLSEEGAFSAVISTDALDRDGEIVAREAFKGSLGKTIPLIQAHDHRSLPVGKGVVGQTAEGTTLEGNFFLDTNAGQEAYKTAKHMASQQEFSVGFMPRKSEYVLVEGKNVRKITDLELFEASLVLVGASRGTRLAAIKAAEPVTTEKALETLKDASHEVLKGLVDTHVESCADDNCPLKANEPEPTPNVSPERQKTLQEISARVAKA